MKIDWYAAPDDSSGILVVAGEMTISHASAIKANLEEALCKTEGVTVDVSSVTAIDVAGVQLLCASHRYANSHGRQVILRLGANEVFAGFINSCGFTRDFICGPGSESGCLWSSGK